MFSGTVLAIRFAEIGPPPDQIMSTWLSSVASALVYRAVEGKTICLINDDIVEAH